MTTAGETGDAKQGGLLLRVNGELQSLSTSVVVRVVALPPVTAVPGSPPDLLGIALHEGVIVPVIAIGPTRDALVICEHAGELVGLVGGEVVEAGTFDAALDTSAIDLAGIYARIQLQAVRVRA